MQYFNSFAILALCSGLASQAVWTQLSPSPAPSGRTTGYGDSDGTNLLVFGGNDTSGTAGDKNDLWRFDGAKWTDITPTNSPPVRRRHAVCWDPVRNVLVLFGGQTVGATGTPYLDDTWEWNGTVWTQKTPATPPPGRRYHHMAYDFIGGRVLLFGGTSAIGDLNDTWGWDGTNWTALNPSSSPSARERFDMVTDTRRLRIVLFGGRQGGTFSSETWTWNGFDWQQITTVTIPYGAGCHNHGMSYDVLRDRVVLYGGVVTGSGRQTETWEFDGTDWLGRGVSPLAPRSAMAIAYVAATQKTYVFGGFGGAGNYHSDTWEYQTSNPASYSPAGGPCGGTAGAPTLVATTPWLGQSFTITVGNLPATSPAFLYLGLSDTTWGTISLPLSLGFLGAANCTLNVSADFLFGLNNQSGTATWTVPIPNLAVLAGLPFFNQAYAGGDTTSNPVGLVVSNYGVGKFGSL